MSIKRHIVRVQDVMTQDYATIDGLTTIREALNIFKTKGASVLIINKRHADDEFGIILLSDIAKKVVAQDRAPERVNVYELMAKPVVTVDPEMDVKYCARLFENLGLSTTPVMKDGDILGVVSYNEIVLEGLL